MSKRTLYIAYGSNINLEQMAFRCPTAKRFGTAILNNYELQFKQVATIAPKENSEVPVLLWELSPNDEKSLDKYEGYPSFYRKEYFEVEIKGETFEAMVSVMNGNRQLMEPSDFYYNAIEKGYLDNGLNTKYLEQALANSILAQKCMPREYEGFQMKYE